MRYKMSHPINNPALQDLIFVFDSTSQQLKHPDVPRGITLHHDCNPGDATVFTISGSRMSLVEDEQAAPLDPLTTQHGGTHYKGRGIQPVQYAHTNKLDFFQGSVVKYVTRFRDKGGKQDLEKARHFIDLLIALEYPAGSKRAEALTRLDVEVKGLEKFLQCVRDEYTRATAKFPSTDCAGIALMEEAGEVGKALLDESSERITEECVQTAVMAARIAIDGDPSTAAYRARTGAGAHPL